MLMYQCMYIPMYAYVSVYVYAYEVNLETHIYVGVMYSCHVRFVQERETTRRLARDPSQAITASSSHPGSDSI